MGEGPPTSLRLAHAGGESYSAVLCASGLRLLERRGFAGCDRDLVEESEARRTGKKL